MELVSAMDWQVAHGDARSGGVSDIGQRPRRVESSGGEGAPARPLDGRRARPRDQIRNTGRRTNGVGLLTHAAACRQSCDLPPRAGNDDAAAARCARSETPGSDQILPRKSDESSLITTSTRRCRDAEQDLQKSNAKTRRARRREEM